MAVVPSSSSNLLQGEVCLVVQRRLLLVACLASSNRLLGEACSALHLPLVVVAFSVRPHARALPNPAFPTRTPGVPVPCRAFLVIGGGRFALF